MGTDSQQTGVTIDPVGRSRALLESIRAGQAGTDRSLEALDQHDLRVGLSTDADRVAFWCNVYNLTAQRALSTDPDRYDDRRSFFRSSLLTIAGHELSLDDIEHSILRRGYSKYTLGYIQHPLWGGFDAAVAPSERDPRIHFALNCGAASCPLIRSYSADSVDEQLDTATRHYLGQTVTYDHDADRVTVPRVFLWFRGDFGGKAGILAFLRRYDQLAPGVTPRLSHRDWDWSRSVGDFVD